MGRAGDRADECDETESTGVTGMATERRRLEWRTDEYPFREGETLVAYVQRVAGLLAPGSTVTEAGATLRMIDVSTWGEQGRTAP